MPNVGRAKSDVDRGIQSVIFYKSHYDIIRAKKWLKNNGFKHFGPDIRVNVIRFRQFDPKPGEDYRFTRLSNGVGVIYVK